MKPKYDQYPSMHQRLTIGLATDSSIDGVLGYDGNGHVQCRICQKWFVSVGRHILRAHGVTAYEYCSQYGLNITQPLCSPEFSANVRASWVQLKGKPLTQRPPRHSKRSSIQANKLNSESHKGRSQTVTPAKLAANRANLAKANRIKLLRKERLLSKVLPALGDSLAPYFLKLAELRVKAIKLCEDANALANLFEEEAKRLEQMDKGRSQTP